jgi:hypothetical protein
MNAELSQRQRNLRRLLRPRHVAIVGGQAMADSIRRCADTDSRVRCGSSIRNTRSLAGACYASIADLPEAPDATFIAVRASGHRHPETTGRARWWRRDLLRRRLYRSGRRASRCTEFVKAAGNLAVVGPIATGCSTSSTASACNRRARPAGGDRLRHCHTERQHRPRLAATTARCRSPTSSAPATKPF